MPFAGSGLLRNSVRILFIPALALVGVLSISPSGAREQILSDDPPLQAQAPAALPTDSLDRPPSDSDSSGTETEADASPTDRPYWRQNLFGRFFRDQKYLFTTWWPSEFRHPGFTAPLLAGTALATTSNRRNGEGADLEMEGYIQNESRGQGEGVARELSFIGDAAAGAVMIGSGYLIGRWSHNDRLAESSSLSAEALLSAGLWSSALKSITARSRPGGGSRGDFFNYGRSQGEEVGSFPSGHATGAFAVATVFAEVYRDHRWVSWVAYGTAGLIGASRVALGRHFPSDVIVGALLGNSFGRMVLAHRQDSENSLSSFQPSIDPTQQAAGLVWTRDW